jgi:hypothetical protein
MITGVADGRDVPFVKGISEKFRRILTVSNTAPFLKLNIHSVGH